MKISTFLAWLGFPLLLVLVLKTRKWVSFSCGHISWLKGYIFHWSKHPRVVNLSLSFSKISKCMMFFIEVKCYHFFTNMGPLGHYHILFCGGFYFHSLITRILSVFFLLFGKVDSFRSFLLHFLPQKQMCLCWCGNLRPKIKVFRTVSFMLNAIFPSWQISWEFPAPSSFVIISFRFLHTLSQILQINKERKPCSSHGACPICSKCLSVSISIFSLLY